MALTNAQKVTLRDALIAEADPGVVNARSIGDAVFLAEWCNGASAVDAWRAAATKRDLFEAMNVTQFDGLTAGKRDAWRMLMDNAPIDCRRNRIRNAVVDVWSTLTAAQRDVILTDLTEKAARVELYLTPNVPANQKTTGGVTALDRTFVGRLTHTEVSEALAS